MVPPGHTLEDLDADGVVLETLRRDQGGPERLIEVLAAAFIHGCPSPGPACCPAGTWTCPTYAFQHGRYWLDEPARSVKPDGLGLAAAGHPLLGCGGGVGAGRQGHVHRTPVAVLPSLAGRPRRPRHRYRPRHRATGDGRLAGGEVCRPDIEELTLTPLSCCPTQPRSGSR